MQQQNRMSWIMGALAAVATLAAVGVGLNGVRGSTLPTQRPPVAGEAAASPRATNPMAPRLFDQNAPLRVHVAGAVKKPGVYSLPGWARVDDAVRKAGGPTANADLDAINLADPLRDGEQLRIPRRGRAERLRAHLPTPEPPPVDPTVGGRSRGRYPSAASSGAGSEAASGGVVNVNTATQQQLEALPGIGPTTAERILAHRQEHGPFLQAEDLMNVKGIGPARFERLREQVVTR